MARKPTYEELEQSVKELEQKALEGKRTDEALRESEERYRTLFENNPIETIVVDKDAHITMYNRAKRTSGDRLPHIGDVMYRDYASSHLIDMHQELMECIKLDKLKEFHEKKYKDKYLYISISPFTEGAIITSIDITDRKLAEATLRRRAEEFTALYETSLDIISSYDLTTLLETIVERAARLLNCTRGGMYKCDPAREEVLCVVSLKTSRDFSGTVLKYGEGAAGTVAQTAKPLIIDDYRKWVDRAMVYEKDQPFSAVISVPMIWHDEVIGVIHVLSDTETRNFSQNDLELLTLFANQATIAIKNAQLIEQAQNDASRLQLQMKKIEERTTKIKKINEKLRKEIDQRNQAEEALRKNKEDFQLHFENVSDVIYSIDRDLNITSVSPAVERLLGYRPEDLIGIRFPDLNILAPEYLEQAISDTMQVFEGKRFYSSRYKFIAKDGSQKIGEVSGAPLFRDGDIVGLVSVARDVTERVQAEEALKASEERFKKLFKYAPDAYYLNDLEGNFLDGNKAAEELIGYQKEELIGKNFFEAGLLPEEQLPKAIELLKRNLEGQTTGPDELILIRKDGGMVTIEVRTLLIKIGDQDVILGIARNITERKQIEEEKKELETQLQQAQKMEAIATLAGGCAHEFNNALTGVVGNIQLLEMSLSDNKTVIEHTEAIKASSHRMINLTSQLLAYARGGKYQAKTMSLSDFVEDTLPIIKPAIGPSIRLETDLPRDVLSVKADPAQMQMVLSAVVRNSTEAIEGDGRIRVTISNEEIDSEFIKNHPGLKPGPYACLTIEDDGKGMDEETLNKIFDPFYTTKFVGRGLGMAAVYGIVRNHDGWVSVDSEIDKGTVVRIYLPAIEPEVKERRGEAVPVEVMFGTGTILVIEDEEMVMNVIRAILIKLGYRILEAKDGKEAIDIAKTFDGQIDLALLDIKLPDIQGDKLYPLIKEARPDLKVIVCSGYSIDTARDILDAGAQDFIQKPFSVKEISQKLREIIDK